MSLENDNKDNLSQEIISNVDSEKRGNDYWGVDQIITDPNLPLLYSKKAIYVFAMIFSVVFGAFLLIMNTKELKKHDAIVPILSFSIGYLISIFWLIDFLEVHYNFTIPNTNLFSSLGGLLLVEIFWRKYIEKDILFRKRKVWKPSIIGAILFFTFIAGYLYLQKQDPLPFDANNYVEISKTKCRVFYDSLTVKNGDAKAIGVFLENIGYFQINTENHAVLKLKENVFTIYFQVNEEFLTNEEALNYFKGITKYLSGQYGNSKTFKLNLYSINNKNELRQKEID